MEKIADPDATSDSYLIQFSSYLPEVTDLTQYLPEKMQKIPLFQPKSKESTEEQGPVVVFSAFDTIQVGQSTTNVLILGYSDGFQVWNIENVNQFEEVSRLPLQIPTPHFSRSSPIKGNM